MKKIVLTLALVMIFGIAATSAQAIIPLQTTASQNVYNAINRILNGTVYTFGSNTLADVLQVYSGDTYWSDLGASAFTGTFVAIGVSAGNSNDLKVYKKSNPSDIHAVFTGITGSQWFGKGTSVDPFTKVSASPFAVGTNFGWQLFSDAPGAAIDYTWDSNALNNDGDLDHMLTYHLSALAGLPYYVTVGGVTTQYTFYDPYLIVWEDLPGLGDKDFNDMMFLVDRVSPNVIPEPMSMALLGSGLLGLVGLRRKRS